MVYIRCYAQTTAAEDFSLDASDEFCGLSDDEDDDDTHSTLDQKCLAIRHYLRKMDISCPVCGALHWINERVSSSSKKTPEFVKCCRRGKVILPMLR
ncbi:hypothetical protein MKX01_040364, partial [Papaver californicum]